jgi:hypothetical protein
MKLQHRHVKDLTVLKTNSIDVKMFVIAGRIFGTGEKIISTVERIFVMPGIIEDAEIGWKISGIAGKMYVMVVKTKETGEKISVIAGRIVGIAGINPYLL